MTSAENRHPPKTNIRRKSASAEKAHPPETDIRRKLTSAVFKTTPYGHQLACFNKTKDMAYTGYFMQQGTGKTKCAIDRSSHIYLRGKVDGVLIICPKSLMETWEEEIATHCAVPYEVAQWDSDLRKKSIALMEKVLQDDPTRTTLPFFIINIEALRTKKGMRVVDWWVNRNRIHAIMDESSKIKTPSAAQTVAAIKVARYCTARTILTGTPVSNSPADYYSQLCFLSPNPLGFSNYYSFRARYCELAQVTVPLPKNKRFGRNGTRKIQQIVGVKNAEELKGRLLDFCFFVKKHECLDLPDKIYHKRYCELTKEGERIYKEAESQMVLDISSDRQLTIEYHLARLCRLQQIVGGFLPSDDDPFAEPIPGNNPKIQLLMETLEEFPGATIIWARYKAEQKAIKKALLEQYPIDTIGEITGSVDKDEREIYRKRFQDPNDGLKYLVCAQSCAGYGYTLTEAENEIYFSNTFSYEEREQSEDRAHRIGQTKHVNIIDLLIRDTKDMDIIIALKRKTDIATLFTDVSQMEE